MRVFTKFSLRFAVYLIVVAYLIADLFLLDGPINRRIQASHPDSPESIAKAKANGVVARVFNHQITRTQLDRAIHERLWLEGKSISDLSQEDVKLVEYAALGDLIDQQLLRVKVKVNTHELEVTDNEIDERTERFIRTFPSKGELEAAMKSQGIPDEKALRNRIAARIQQEKYVAMRIDPLVQVSDEEITTFYKANLKNLKIPERIRARHIFIATLDTPSDKAKSTLEKALADLNGSEKDFATLAQEISNDSASKYKGGDLGWMSKARLPSDFTESVFAMAINKPALLRTKIGWHIVEVTDRRPAETPAIEDLREEIKSAITTIKRQQATNDFRAALRRFEREKVDIFHDQLVH